MILKAYPIKLLSHQMNWELYIAQTYHEQSSPVVTQTQSRADKNLVSPSTTSTIIHSSTKSDNIMLILQDLQRHIRKTSRRKPCFRFSISPLGIPRQPGKSYSWTCSQGPQELDENNHHLKSTAASATRERSHSHRTLATDGVNLYYINAIANSLDNLPQGINR